MIKEFPQITKKLSPLLLTAEQMSTEFPSINVNHVEKSTQATGLVGIDIARPVRITKRNSGLQDSSRENLTVIIFL